MGLLSGGPTFSGIFISEIWWAYYPVGLLFGGLTYGILRYLKINKRFTRTRKGEKISGSWKLREDLPSLREDKYFLVNN